MKINMLLAVIVFFANILIASSDEIIGIRNNNVKIEYDSQLNSRILFCSDTSYYPLTRFNGSERIILADTTVKKFNLKSVKNKKTVDELGKGEIILLTGKSGNGEIPLLKQIEIIKYNEFPDILIFKVKYKNVGENQINVKGWINNDYILPEIDTGEVFWSFQAASYEDRPDWVKKIPVGFAQENYMGMNASDYGGGFPVVDVWNKDVGIAIGHLETVPKLVSLPVSRTDQKIELKIKYEKPITLNPGETLKVFETFVMLHNGDFFKSLKTYSRIMQRKGLKISSPPETTYEPIWCAWGYERNFDVEEVLNTLPKVKELGLKWAVIDDGWQTSEGDWYLHPQKFPHGDTDMIKLVETIHSFGLKAKLWWVPLAVDPGTDLIKNHKDMLLINKEGKPQKISWWESFYLCPAYEPTLEYTKRMVRKFIHDWGFDGLKIDGQHLNAAPPCYNPLHNHKYPEESTEAMPKFFKIIYDEVMKIKPDGIVEVCPCGTGYNFFMLPYLNQVVASDPTSSWQIRLKGKTFKALLGRKAPYYGDHVELSTGGKDFASTVGIGGIIGTKFVWPVGVHINTESGDVSLTPEREKEWEKWINIYKKYKLYDGEYLGELYDIGFDRPETHVIAKGDTLFYAFYADKYEGLVEFRGLKANEKYKIYDYVNNQNLGELNGNCPFQKVSFQKYLLLMLHN